ncbi:hypothetical protein [Luethyella okanaganae]|uniref:Uncharacterized protein n=1 Tax=Luethyella okanaganae TaxID=69372 RepID=A0ABW1VJ13_9MICO
MRTEERGDGAVVAPALLAAASIGSWSRGRSSRSPWWTRSIAAANLAFWERS